MFLAEKSRVQMKRRILQAKSTAYCVQLFLHKKWVRDVGLTVVALSRPIDDRHGFFF